MLALSPALTAPHQENCPLACVTFTDHLASTGLRTEEEDNMKLAITASFVSPDLSQQAPGQPVATERENKGPRWLPVSQSVSQGENCALWRQN